MKIRLIHVQLHGTTMELTADIKHPQYIVLKCLKLSCIFSHKTVAVTPMLNFLEYFSKPRIPDIV